MTPADLLTDAFGRVHDTAAAAVDGLTPEQLAARPGAAANPVGWLVWHLARVQDDHLADVAGVEQVWTSRGFAGRFGLDLPDSDTGFGHSAEQVARVRVDAESLTDYLAAVHQQTLGFVGSLDAEDLDRIIDIRWDPPVTLGVRLVSVISDDLQHAGQAAYARGLLL